MESDSNSHSRGTSSSLGREYTRDILGKFLNSKSKPVNKANLLRKMCMYTKLEFEIKKKQQGILDINEEEKYQAIQSRTLINKLKANDIGDILKSEPEIMNKLFSMENNEFLETLNIFCICGARHNDREEQCCQNISKLQEFIKKIVEYDICTIYLNN
jgi:hypothetical protein